MRAVPTSNTRQWARWESLGLAALSANRNLPKGRNILLETGLLRLQNPMTKTRDRPRRTARWEILGFELLPAKRDPPKGRNTLQETRLSKLQEPVRKMCNRLTRGHAYSLDQAL